VRRRRSGSGQVETLAPLAYVTLRAVTRHGAEATAVAEHRRNAAESRADGFRDTVATRRTTLYRL
jgi:hypothetical protein